MYLVKINASGDTLWTYWYDAGPYDKAWAGQQTMDGGHIMAGEADDGTNALIIRTNNLGDTLWVRKFGFASAFEKAFSIWQLPDSGFIAAGYSARIGGSPDMFVFRIDACGDTLWTRLIGGAGEDYAYAVYPTADGGWIVAGSTTSFGSGSTDIYLVRLASEHPSSAPQYPSLPLQLSLSANPNPFNPSTTISFSLPRNTRARLAVFDILGREVRVLADENFAPGEHRVLFDGFDLPSGIYFARMQSGEFVATQKLLLLK